MKKQTLIRVGVVVLVVLTVLGVLYFFGGMQPRTPEMRAAWDAEVAAGNQPDVEARFVISIPGCVCHSDDPGLQAQHSMVRISECRRCHGNG